MKPRLSLIVALTENRAIGKKNGLLFHVPGDLPRFKKITLGHPIIMGRKSYESIGRPLPGRLNIIITHDPHYSIAGATVVHSLEDAIKIASDADQTEIFVIGGGQIFAEALPLADRLYLTVVHQEYDGADTFFPDYSMFKTEVENQPQQADGMSFTYLTLER